MALRPFTDPIVAALRALGVMFANPPPGGPINGFAGINFADDGTPTNIQDLSGNTHSFPGGGGGAIPIPAINSGANVVINSAQGGNITIAAPDEVAGDGGTITIAGGFSPDGNGGSANLAGQNGFAYGGEVNITSGTGANGDAGGATIFMAGGNGNPGQGANVVITAGNNAPSAGRGGSVSLQAGNAAGAGDAGDVELLAGGRVGGGGAVGKLKFGRANGGTLHEANGSGTVDVGAKAPGAVNVTISAWIPITVDGVDYIMPLFAAA